MGDCKLNLSCDVLQATLDRSTCAGMPSFIQVHLIVPLLASHCSFAVALKVLKHVTSTTYKAYGNECKLTNLIR